MRANVIPVIHRGELWRLHNAMMPKMIAKSDSVQVTKMRTISKLLKNGKRAEMIAAMPNHIEVVAMPVEVVFMCLKF